MGIKREAFKLTGFNKENPFVSSIVVLGEKTYNITVKWLFKFDFGIITIYDENNNLIVGATALVNNLVIRIDQRKLPGYLKFVHVDGELYEPEIDNIEKEFIFYYVQ